MTATDITGASWSIGIVFRARHPDDGSFKPASGGATLHQLRHSWLTHLAEAGIALPILMAKSPPHQAEQPGDLCQADVRRRRRSHRGHRPRPPALICTPTALIACLPRFVPLSYRAGGISQTSRHFLTAEQASPDQGRVKGRAARPKDRRRRPLRGAEPVGRSRVVEGPWRPDARARPGSCSSALCVSASVNPRSGAAFREVCYSSPHHPEGDEDARRGRRAALVSDLMSTDRS